MLIQWAWQVVHSPSIKHKGIHYEWFQTLCLSTGTHAHKHLHYPNKRSKLINLINYYRVLYKCTAEHNHQGLVLATFAGQKRAWSPGCYYNGTCKLKDTLGTGHFILCKKLSEVDNTLILMCWDMRIKAFFIKMLFS